jgi:sulfite reductase (NADPH) hemoprotein beta-component
MSSANEAGQEVSRNEELKSACPTLAGTIVAGLSDTAADHFSNDDAEFLKFHGIYQGDNRDARKAAKQYAFLVRARLPGGILGPEQYLVLDRLAEEWGDHTLRLTSRQSVQLHGVRKSSLGSAVKALNDAGVTTLAACGDVARNVMASPAPTTRLVEQIQQQASRISDILLPRTPAYRRIWIEGGRWQTANEQIGDFVDPLYGPTYLPRKFKIALAIPPLNDVDVFTHCLGLVAIVQADEIVGYNLLAGGGMGMTFGNPQTYARLADPACFIEPEQVEAAVKAVLGIHRDFSDALTANRLGSSTCCRNAA